MGKNAGKERAQQPNFAANAILWSEFNGVLFRIFSTAKYLEIHRWEFGLAAIKLLRNWQTKKCASDDYSRKRNYYKNCTQNSVTIRFAETIKSKNYYRNVENNFLRNSWRAKLTV